MPLTDHQKELLTRAERLAATGAPAQGALLLLELLESIAADEQETRGRVTVTLGHFLKQAGDTEHAVESYLAAALLLESIAGEGILEAAHAYFSAGLIMVETNQPQATRTTARAFALYRRYPFTRPADLADAAVLNLAAQVFVEQASSEKAFRETWEPVRAASPDEMTPELLEQWLLLVQTWVEMLPEEKGAELARDLRRWTKHAEGEGQLEQNVLSAPPPESVSPQVQYGLPDELRKSRDEFLREQERGAVLSQRELLAEIRNGYDELLRGQERGTTLPQVEIDVIEMTLRDHDPDRLPRTLLGAPFFSLGRCFTELDDEAAAERYYRQSLTCNPKHARARYNLGNILLRRGEKDAAVEQYELVVKADPNNSFALRNLTYALAKSGKLRSAIEIAATTALAATDPAATAARLLELCAHYDGWKLAGPLVEEILGSAHAPLERISRLRELLAPLLRISQND
jgi:tetratricopeptide (TPR) repeat protein